MNNTDILWISTFMDAGVFHVIVHLVHGMMILTTRST